MTKAEKQNKHDNQTNRQYRHSIARWIYHDCDTPIEEIVYLLKKAYPKFIDLESEYDAVLEFYNSQKSNEEEN
tara:strand:+ start:383 stop:601 length:219 start_codon:yes stop_codon:yes gene_type:complete